MRICVAVAPAPGVFNHCVALAILLTKGGHDVYLVTGPDLREHSAYVMNPFETHYLESHNFDLLASGAYHEIVCARGTLARQLEEILIILKKSPVDFLITKYVAYGPIVSSILGIRSAVYYTDGPAFLSITSSPRASIDHEAVILDELDAAASRYGVRLPAVDSLYAFKRLAALDIVRGTPLSTGVTETALRDRSSRAVYCGLPTYDGRVQRGTCWAPAQDRPLAYVSFGTMYKDTGRFDMLERSIKIAGLNGIFTSRFFEESPPHSRDSSVPSVIRYRYLPSAGVLPRASVVVHHGGHGMYINCLLHGLPQLIIPFHRGTGQVVHAQRAEDLGVGRNLSESGLSIESATMELQNLVAAKVRHRCEEVKSLIDVEDAQLRERFLQLMGSWN